MAIFSSVPVVMINHSEDEYTDAARQTSAKAWHKRQQPPSGEGGRL